MEATAQCTQTPPQIDFVFHASHPSTNPATTEPAASGQRLREMDHQVRHHAYRHGERPEEPREPSHQKAAKEKFQRDELSRVQRFPAQQIEPRPARLRVHRIERVKLWRERNEPDHRQHRTVQPYVDPEMPAKPTERKIAAAQPVARHHSHHDCRQRQITRDDDADPPGLVSQHPVRIEPGATRRKHVQEGLLASDELHETQRQARRDADYSHLPKFCRSRRIDSAEQLRDRMSRVDGISGAAKAGLRRPSSRCNGVARRTSSLPPVSPLARGSRLGLSKGLLNHSPHRLTCSRTRFVADTSPRNANARDSRLHVTLWEALFADGSGSIPSNAHSAATVEAMEARLQHVRALRLRSGQASPDGKQRRPFGKLRTSEPPHSIGARFSHSA